MSMSTRDEQESPAGKCIDVNVDADVSYWTHTLGISELDLRKAIAEVGPDVNAVQGYVALLAPLDPH
jgi:hypothetical protein